MTVRQSAVDGPDWPRTSGHTAASSRNGRALGNTILDGGGETMASHPMKSIAEMSDWNGNVLFLTRKPASNGWCTAVGLKNYTAHVATPTLYFPPRCTNIAGDASAACRTLAIPSTISVARFSRTAPSAARWLKALHNEITGKIRATIQASRRCAGTSATPCANRVSTTWPANLARCRHACGNRKRLRRFPYGAASCPDPRLPVLRADPCSPPSPVHPGRTTMAATEVHTDITYDAGESGRANGTR